MNNQYNEINKKLNQNTDIKNKLIEKNRFYENQREILLTKEKNMESQNNEFIKLKNSELNILKQIYSNINFNSTLTENSNSENRQLFLLLKVLKIINKKYGPLQNLLTQTNSIESQRINLKNILNKFKNELDQLDNIS